MLAPYLALIDDDGDKNFFETVYYSYRKQMLYSALEVLRNKNDAEDVVHEVFCRIASGHIELLRQMDNQDDLRNYLLKAVKNTSLNVLRSRKKPVVSLDTAEKYEEQVFKDISDSFFVDIVCAKIDCERLMEELDNLGETYRDALYYHFVVGHSVPEVAKLLDRSVAAVKKQLVRGKSQLIHNLGLEAAER